MLVTMGNHAVNQARCEAPIRKGYSDKREYHFLEVSLTTGGVRKNWAVPGKEQANPEKSWAR
jgi:hypothetical protein